MAKELNEDERTEDGMYRMTSMTGSVRYLAPEVILGNPYNEKADVYSFGILFWYMMAFEPPFGLYTKKMILERVPKGHHPVAVDAWPEGMKNILKMCFSTKAMARPDFHTVMKTLKDEVAAVNPDKCDNMIHHSPEWVLPC
jgi:serine/threonine protein kinase